MYKNQKFSINQILSSLLGLCCCSHSSSRNKCCLDPYLKVVLLHLSNKLICLTWCSLTTEAEGHGLNPPTGHHVQGLSNFQWLVPQWQTEKGRYITAPRRIPSWTQHGCQNQLGLGLGCCLHWHPWSKWNALKLFCQYLEFNSRPQIQWAPNCTAEKYHPMSTACIPS